MPRIPSIPIKPFFREKEPTYIPDSEISDEGDLNNNRDNHTNRSLSTYFWKVVLFLEDETKAMAKSLANRACYSFLIYPIAKRVHYIIFGRELERPQSTTPHASSKSSLVQEKCPIEISKIPPPVHMPGVNNSCWAAAFWQLFMAMPMERWFLYTLENNKEITEEVIQNIGSQVSIYNAFQETRERSLPVDFTDNVRKNFNTIMGLDELDVEQQDLLELTDTFFERLLGLADDKLGDFAGLFVCSLHDQIQLDGDEYWEREDSPVRTYGAQFGSLVTSEARIVPDEQEKSLDSWFNSFFTHTVEETPARRQFEKAPHMFMVKVERTENDGEIGTNEKSFVTPNEVFFDQGTHYQSGEDRTQYRRAGCIVHDGVLAKIEKSEEFPDIEDEFINVGHFAAYIEQSDGKIYRCDDAAQTCVNEVISKEDLEKYHKEMNEQGILFLYSRVDS